MAMHPLNYHCYSSEYVPLAHYLKHFAVLKYLENSSSILLVMKSCSNKIFFIVFFLFTSVRYGSEYQYIFIVGWAGGQSGIPKRDNISYNHMKKHDIDRYFLFLPLLCSLKHV